MHKLTYFPLMLQRDDHHSKSLCSLLISIWGMNKLLKPICGNYIVSLVYLRKGYRSQMFSLYQIWMVSVHILDQIMIK